MEREDSVARVAICDPSEISTVGIAHPLSRQGMEVANALEPVAASLIGSGLANVVLADPSMRRFGEVTRSAVLAGMPVIAIGVTADPANAFAALRAGACGYITKDLPARSWVEAIKAALPGEAPLSRAMTACLVGEFRSLGPPSAILEYLPSNRRLTKREWNLLPASPGHTNRRVAEQLSISMETVRTHVSNILAKLETPNRSGAAEKYHQLRSAQQSRPAVRVTISPPQKSDVWAMSQSPPGLDTRAMNVVASDWPSPAVPSGFCWSAFLRKCLVASSRRSRRFPRCCACRSPARRSSGQRRSSTPTWSWSTSPTWTTCRPPRNHPSRPSG